ncbi:sugar ABC transporter ATP-binding protein [Agrobacterium vitis]|uniref:sugar ABC transporter ATP-binding protein n=1 Tax=Agrobacterium vitis TaxID=373 RepID=UPI0008722290|nr:sugar ABC transporter ATP-binding protein [Agrobacterium vitis]MCE6077390.1 ATP-binding cassette domain-containing protein [Agrobacterium vitis]MCM2468512.1 sugar ABC transporter ATP-binding protein [Agrobacterium vitis]MUO70497.1 ATP-binding cassette domain-containing protein [Agrobacterium vitis]MUO82783.1 ATP-binding cassette domain-containing protein [Agrobacterium vitis]MVA33213.1 ATP-binding cassette domain-containing protein [Agrobacterium vitis]
MGGVSLAAGECKPAPLLLKLEGVTKEFPGVKALQDVSLDVRAGEVHAVCGENGAGKSTLMKIISGVYQRDAGNMIYKGETVHFTSTLQSEAAGIAIIHQELNLVPHLSVAENIYLAREPRLSFMGGRFMVDRRKLRQDAKRCLDRLGVDINPDAQVRTLSVAQRQMVEIAKALSLDASVLIMDEPTSSLTQQEAQLLFRVIRDLKREGTGIIYISHRLDEMAEIVDRVTVLRDGRYISTDDFDAITVDYIVARMVGRSLEEKFPAPTRSPTRDTIFSVSGLSRHGVFSDIGFELRRGEILGFAGLMGAGRTEVARAIFGADPFDSGTILLEGRPLSISDPRSAIDAGIAYLSEDRKAEGLAVKMPVDANLMMANMEAVSNPFGVVDKELHRQSSQHYVDLLNIRTPGLNQPVRLLSGGNQQKIIIGKWLFRQPKIMFFDEPTRGIDVGAKLAIYRLMDELAAKGIGIILISSELPEILGLSDRVAVFHEGRITATLTTRETSQEEIMLYASGRVRESARGMSHG